MELVQYIRLFRKWFWLLLLAGIIGGGVSFVVTSRQPAQYTATTTLSIGRYIEALNPDSSDIRTGIDLAQTYAQLIRTRDVLQGTIDVLGLQQSTDRLSSLFETRILTGTSLLVVTVTYTDPVTAADIANTLAQQLILKSPTNLTSEQQVQVEFANEQIRALSQQIEEQRATLTSYNAQLENVSDEDERTRLNELKVSLIDQINQASATIATFQNTISGIQQRTNALDIVEQASIPTAPVGRSAVTSALLGAMVGIALAAGIALLVEYLDDRVKSTEIATQVLALPVLGAIPKFPGKGGVYPERLITKQPSMSPTAEAYRRLRTNLMFTSSNGNGHKSVFVVTSAGPEEGKSVTTANLAVTMALAGVNVLLIDADLRRPKVHEIFELKNEVGLTTLLFADPGTGNGNAPESENAALSSLKQCLQTTSIPRLKVITSGFVPSNPTEILGSVLMKRWIDTFRSASDIDVVLVDTPPALMFADSSVLAAIADADVVLVLDGGKTRRGAALEVKDRFAQLGLEIKGVVVNRLNPREEAGGYGYGYGYGYYYYSSGEGAEQGKKKGLFGVRRG